MSVNQIINNIQDLLISPRLNDFMMLYISAMDQARKLKFNSYVHLPSINKMLQYRYAWVIL